MQPQKLSPSTPLAGLGALTLGDFWSWAYSDLLSNGNRSVYAEFLVGTALGVTQAPRREWDFVDLRYGDKLIEVKASGYAQSWEPSAKPSLISFDIGKKFPWDGETNTYGSTCVRSADCYVFCVHNETDRERARLSVIDAASWSFYVVATEQIERAFGEQKKVRLTMLAARCKPVDFPYLRAAVDAALGESPAQP